MGTSLDGGFAPANGALGNGGAPSARSAAARAAQTALGARVLVVDRWSGFAQALSQTLRLRAVTAAAATFDDVAAAVRGFRPDILVVDADADADASAVAAAVDAAREVVDDVKVLLLSSGDGTIADKAMSVTGAVGWMSRDAGAHELLMALEEVRDAGELSRRRPPAMRRRAAKGSTGPGSSLLEHLSAREREVLTAVMAGSVNDEVARRLGISPNTVRTHMQNILAKLGVRSRLEAVAVARREGLRPAGGREGVIDGG